VAEAEHVHHGAQLVDERRHVLVAFGRRLGERAQDERLERRLEAGHELRRRGRLLIEVPRQDLSRPLPSHGTWPVSSS
jgi:hypothetical protein